MITMREHGTNIKQDGEELVGNAAEIVCPRAEEQCAESHIYEQRENVHLEGKSLRIVKQKLFCTSPYECCGQMSTTCNVGV